MDFGTLGALVKEAGPWVALCAFFVWESWKRESRMAARLDSYADQDAKRQETMVSAIRSVNATLRALCDALRVRPCLIDEPETQPQPTAQQRTPIPRVPDSTPPRSRIVGIILLGLALTGLHGCFRVPVTVHPPAAENGDPIALPTAPTGEVQRADGSVDRLNPAFPLPKPSDHPPQPGFTVDWTLLIGGVLALLTGGGLSYGRAHARRAAEARQDMEDEYQRANDAERAARAYAERVPPPQEP